MNRILLVILMLFGVTQMHAQNESDTVEYNYIIDDPYDLPAFNVYLNPVSFQMSGLNLINAGFSVGAKSMIKDRLTIDLDYSMAAYFDWSYFNEAIQQNFLHPDVSGVSINQEFKRSYQFQGSIGVVIKDQARTEKKNIALNSATNGVIIMTQVLPVDYTRRRIISSRGGVTMYTTKFSPSNLSLEDNYWAADDGTKFYASGDIGFTDVDYDDTYSFTQSTATDPEGERLFSEWSSQLNVTAVTAGICITNISNLMIDTKYGKRGSRGMNQFYLDVMYAPIMTMTDILFFESDTTLESNIGTTQRFYNVEGDGVDQVRLNPFGVRMGFYGQTIAKSGTKKFNEENPDPLRRLFNLGYKMELGVMPGPGFRDFYFNLGLMWPMLSF